MRASTFFGINNIAHYYANTRCAAPHLLFLLVNSVMGRSSPLLGFSLYICYFVGDGDGGLMLLVDTYYIML